MGSNVNITRSSLYGFHFYDNTSETDYLLVVQVCTKHDHVLRNYKIARLEFYRVQIIPVFDKLSLQIRKWMHWLFKVDDFGKGWMSKSLGQFTFWHNHDGWIKTLLESSLVHLRKQELYMQTRSGRRFHILTNSVTFTFKTSSMYKQ